MTIAALLVAGCSGGGASGAGSSIPTSVQKAPTASQTFQGTTKSTLHVSSLKSYHDDNPDVELVSILQLDTRNGDASFSSYGPWDCLAWGGLHGDAVTRDDDGGWGFGWGNGPIYSPFRSESFAMPSFSMNNPCAWQHGYSRWDGNYYVVEVAIDWFNNITLQAISGPGSEQQTNINFPSANDALTMQPGMSYAFLLVATTGTLSTPAPANTPTPFPSTSPVTGSNCPTYTNMASAPSFTTTPAPAYSNPAPHNVSYASMSGEISGPANGSVTCDPATGVIYGTQTNAAYFGYDPSAASASSFTTGASSASTQIADVTGTLFMNNGTSNNGLIVTSAGSNALANLALTLTKSVVTVGSIASGSNGDAYVAGALAGVPTVFQVTLGGVVVPYVAPTKCTGFTASTADSSGNIYLADKGCGIVKMTSSGSFTTLASIAKADTASFLAVGPDGAIYYPSISNSGFVRVDAGGAGATAYVLGTPSISNNVLALVAGPDGHLWFSADELSGGQQTGGDVGYWDPATGQVLGYGTTVAGSNDPTSTNASTAPLSLIDGPSGTIFGATPSTEENMLRIAVLSIK